MIQEPQSLQLRQEDQRLIPRLPDPFPDEIDLPPIDDINNDPADRDEFDETYLAKRGDWNIGGSVSSPAPYPLQVIPRMAYTINYQLVYDVDEDRWVPQKKSSETKQPAVDTGSISLAGNGAVTAPVAVFDESQKLKVSVAFADASQLPGGNVVEIVNSFDIGGFTSIVGYALRWNTNTGQYDLVFKDNDLGGVTVDWAVFEVV